MIIAAAGGAPKPWISLFFDNFFFPRVKLNAQSSIRNLQSIVANELQSLLDGIGFDPYAGFYHVAEYGRPSLALDLLEEFRHSLVDRLALHLFNQNVFAAADFQNVAAGGIHLNREGQKKFFRGYERYLGDYHGSPPGASVGHFRRHFKNQAYKLAKAIQEKGGYQPFDLSAPEAAAAETGDPPW